MGSEELNPAHISLIIDFYNEVKLSLESKSDLDIQKVVHQLISFIYSFEFKLYLFEEMWFVKKLFPFCDIISIYEMKEKFLSLKLLILVFEEIKKDRVKFKEVVKKFLDFFERSLTGIMDPKDSDIIKKFKVHENSQKAIQEISVYIKNKFEHIKVISKLTKGIFVFLFKDELKELLDEYNFDCPNIHNELHKGFDNLLAEFYKEVNEINVLNEFNHILIDIYNKEEFISLTENLNIMKLDPLHSHYTKNIYYTF